MDGQPFHGVPIFRNSSELPQRSRDAKNTNSTQQIVSTILNDVRQRGIAAVVENGIKFNELAPHDGRQTIHPDLFLTRAQLQESFESLTVDDQECLIRVRDRIHRFAATQRNALESISLPFPGGTIGHEVVPVKRAGCYAPGGRYPLPSSVLMTAVTARAANVENVIVASPKPSVVTKAAAYIAGADGLLTVGGAAAISAMAYGLPPVFDACDVVVGPGNNYVTEAKRQISGDVRIDLLAGPSEVFIIADKSADPKTIACDMIAQAEHDVEASAVLITDSELLANAVNSQLCECLAELPHPNLSIASSSLTRNSGILIVHDLLIDGIDAVNENAPEHLEIMTRNSTEIRKRVENAGAIFEGIAAAEVFGDYGVGPNHTLPTSKAAKYRGGLSVYDFLRIRTWVKADERAIEDSGYQDLVQDTIRLARLEGLYGHARSAECRMKANALVANRSITANLDVDELSGIIRDDVDLLMEYHPVKSLTSIAEEVGCSVNSISKLNANENLYGPPKGMAAAVSERLQREAYVYPDPDQIELRQRLVNYSGRKLDEIVCGAGGDDMIQLIVQICRRSGIVISTPTFPMYDFFARINRSLVHSVPLSKFPDFNVDIQRIISTVNSTGASIVYLASPNNPTGQVIPHDQIMQLCQSLKHQSLIVIDEAYIEFSDRPSCVPLLDLHSNLCIIRTFSKWAGLAGLRCGYCLAHPTLTKRLLQIKIPYNLNLAASVAACFALDHYEEVFRIVQLLKTERRHLEVMLQSHSVFPHISTAPSDANFVLLQFYSNQRETATQCHQRLWKSGILTRKYNVPELQDCIRISSGTPTDTRKLIKALSCHTGVSQLPDAIFFDMDGVLADVSESYRVVIMETCEHFGADRVTKEDVQSMKKEGGFNNDWLLTQELIRRQSGIQIPLEEVRDYFNVLYRERSSLEKLIIPIEELNYLKDLVPMGIVTGRPRCDADEFIDRFQLRSIFKVVVCMEDTEKHKPDPAPLLFALEKLEEVMPGKRFDKAQILYIGDTGDDMRAAVAANRYGDNKAGTKWIPVGVIPPQNGNEQAMEYAEELYGCGATIVGLRWDCVAALGVEFAEASELPQEMTSSTTDGTTIASTPDEGFIQQERISSEGRRGKISRKTKETSISCEVNLDGKGNVQSKSGIGFLDHMIDQLGKHGSFDIVLECHGDLHIDDHHSVEDCAIVLGQTIDQALGDRRGIRRFGFAFAPLDESLSRVVVDLAGRGWSEISMKLEREKIGDLSSEMVHHFFTSLATSMRASIHVDVLRGLNAHHQVESSFKALALALKTATSQDKDNKDGVPSTKGLL